MRTRNSNTPLFSSPAAGPANGTRSRSSVRISVAAQTSPAPPSPDPTSPTSNEALWTRVKQLQGAMDIANEGHAVRLEKLSTKVKQVIRKLKSVKQRNKRKLDHIYRAFGKAAVNGFLTTKNKENAEDNSSDSESNARMRSTTPTRRPSRDNKKRPLDHDSPSNSDSDGNDKDDGRVRKRQKISTPNPQPEADNIQPHVATTSTEPLRLLPAPSPHTPQPNSRSDVVDSLVLPPPAPGLERIPPPEPTSGSHPKASSANNSHLEIVRYNPPSPVASQRSTFVSPSISRRATAFEFGNCQGDNAGEGPSRHRGTNQGFATYGCLPQRFSDPSAAGMSASRDGAQERPANRAKGDNEPKPPRSLRTRLYTRDRRFFTRSQAASSSQQGVSGGSRAQAEVKVEDRQDSPGLGQRRPSIKEECSQEIKQEMDDGERGMAEVEDHLLRIPPEHRSPANYYFGRPLVRGPHAFSHDGARNPSRGGQPGNFLEDDGARGSHIPQPLRRDERTIEQDARGEPIINYYPAYPSIDDEIVDVGSRRSLRRDERAILEDDYGTLRIGYYSDYPKLGSRHHFP